MDGPHGGGNGSIFELGHHQVHLSLCLGVRLGRVQHPDSGPQLPRDSKIHSKKYRMLSVASSFHIDLITNQ